MTGDWWIDALDLKVRTDACAFAGAQRQNVAVPENGARPYFGATLVHFHVRVWQRIRRLDRELYFARCDLDTGSGNRQRPALAASDGERSFAIRLSVRSSEWRW